MYENIKISLNLIGVKKKEDVNRKIDYVLEKLGIYRYKNRTVNTLSGGEKQRVSIARAISKNPSIIIADEPTGNLDSKNSLEIMKILKSLSKEKLVILVTHEIYLAKQFTTRIIEIQNRESCKRL